MKHFLIAFSCVAFGSIATFAQDNDSVKVNYKPQIHGTIRAKFEYEPEISSSRFEVRNARVSFDGDLSRHISYKAEIDLSDEGSIKMLDAYGRYKLNKEDYFTIGQMRVPFTIDAHRSPHQQYFANRSFIAKQVGNVRDVGATLRYKFEVPFPITLEAGVFNGSGLTNQKNYWTSKVNYSAKAQLQFCKELNLVLSTQAIRPNDVRINMYDVGMTFKYNRITAEAEFLYKHYEKEMFKNVKAFNSFVNYSVPLHKFFNSINFLARYDSMTDHNDGSKNDEGNLYITDYGRKRVTGGITLSFLKPFRSDIRINYEKYFYKSDAKIKVSEQDKFVVEFMTRF